MSRCLVFIFINLLLHPLFSQQEINQQLRALKEKADKFNVYLNLQTGLDVLQQRPNDFKTAFKARQLRLEFLGNITPKLFYRLRHRLNRSNQAFSLDNLSQATDMMYVGYHFNDKFSLIGGKIVQAWGGFEFDLNPIYIYEYSDFINHMDNFMLGIHLSYRPKKNQEWVLQITNARNRSFKEIYPNSSDIRPSSLPLTYILNWNGAFFKDKVQTRWAYGIQTEAKNHLSHMAMLGAKLHLKKWQVFFDYHFAREDIDRLGYAAVYKQGVERVEAPPLTLSHVFYHTYIVKAEYRPTPFFNTFVKGMYERADANERYLPEGFKNSAYRSYGYFAGTEYMPFKTRQDLRLFLVYVGRKYVYQNEGRSNFSHRLSVGIIYRIPAF